MYSKKLMVVCVIVALLGVTATAAAVGEKQWRKSLKCYAKNDFQGHEAELTLGIEKCQKGDKLKIKNFNLLHLQRGLYWRSIGDYQKAQADFTIAYANSDIDKTGSEKLKEFIFYDGSNQYKLEKREQCFLHFYMAINELLLGEYDRALVEAKKTEWIGEDEDSLPEINFLRSVIHFQLAEYDEAAVAARACIEKDPSFSSSYLLLAKSLNMNPSLAQNGEKVVDLLEKARALSGYEKVDLDYKLVILDLPKFKLKPEAVFRSETIAGDVVIQLEGNLLGSMIPGTTGGDIFRKAAKEVAREVTREAIKSVVPFAGLFMGKEEARSWAFLPKYLVVLPVPADSDMDSIMMETKKKKWSLQSVANPVLVEHSDVGYVSLKPNKHGRK